MNPDQTEFSDEERTARGFSLDDMFFTLFRHKWLILFFTCMGIGGAVAVYFVRPPRYESTAKLKVRYVLENRGVSPPGQEAVVKMSEPIGNVIDSEAQILRSLNVAEQVVDLISAEKILAMKGGGDDRLAAAGVVAGGILVANPMRTDVMEVTFQHPDKTLVQPVLDALIQMYLRKHYVVHSGIGTQGEFFREQRDQLRTDLDHVEEELRKLKAETRVVSMDEAKRVSTAQIQKLTDELNAAKAEMAERKSVLKEGDEAVAVPSPGKRPSLSPEQIEDYTDIVMRLDELKQRKRVLLRDKTEAHPEVVAVIANLNVLERKKEDMESKFPALTRISLNPVPNVTNTFVSELGEKLDAFTRANARVKELERQLAEAQAEALKIVEMEPQIAQLERQRDLAEKRYSYYASHLDQVITDDALGSGKVTNISIVETPTPPKRDFKSLLKWVVRIFGTCVAMGLGLAFMIDFVLDHTIKRRVEVERHLQLPLLLAIPDSNRRGWLGLRRRSRRTSKKVGRNASAEEKERFSHFANGVIRWEPGHDLQQYTEGLRERVITHFEVNDWKPGQPKRVALTSCGSGAGVTTLATGLAVALSRMPEVKVLLVNMNVGQGVARTFENGEPKSNGWESGDSPTAESGGDTSSGELSVVPSHATHNGQSARSSPSGLTRLPPQFDAGDHDFIIFDLPPVSQTSVTPRLSGYMDMVLLVLEAGKTGRESANHASKLMRESRANVAVVLNKCRRYMPALLGHDF